MLFIGGVFIMQVTSSAYELNYIQPTQNDKAYLPNSFIVIGSDSIEQGCCGHDDDTAPKILLLSPGNTSTLLVDYQIAFEITDDNPMEDFLAEEILYNWDGGSNSTLTSPFNVSMVGTDGLHILNMYAVDALENWAHKKYTFTTTSDPGAVQIIGGPVVTTTTVPRRSDGFLLLTIIPISILAAILFNKRER
jgi:hypothetical protein